MQLETVDFATGAATWQTKRNILVILDPGPLVPLCEHMTLFTKPDIHNILRRRQRRT